MSVLRPVLPDYAGGCLSNVIPVLCAPGGPSRIPDWMPSCVEGAPRVVVLLVDGLGWNQLQMRTATPAITQYVADPAGAVTSAPESQP